MMDLSYYRQREQAERALAGQARGQSARAAHLELADRYRAAIEAEEALAGALDRTRDVA